MRIGTALKRARRYHDNYGTRQLLRELGVRVIRKLRWWVHIARVGRPKPPPPPVWAKARDLVRERCLQLTPLPLFTIPQDGPGRVSLVTDNINRGSLYGGVGTSIIMAALIAEARGVRLRIITRAELADHAGLQPLLDSYRIQLSHDIEFAFAPFDSGTSEIDRFEGELFITTSWWGTTATLASVPSECIVYLLQEDERMFYSYGDRHLMCSRLLQNQDIRFVVNSRLLYDHLVESGLANIEARGMWFEPSFPSEVFYPRERRPGAKRKLLFYARPRNKRNLFYWGLNALDAAITRGIVDLQQWDVVLVGKDIPLLLLDDGRYTPERLENLTWTQYAELAGQTDLALCLMYTPHPSYPPFDLAASGAVVVTNRFANKQDLSAYSANILCGDLDLDAMLETIARGVQLAEDLPRRKQNFDSQQLGKDWKESFAQVVKYIDGAA